MFGAGPAPFGKTMSPTLPALHEETDRLGNPYPSPPFRSPDSAPEAAVPEATATEHVGSFVAPVQFPGGRAL